MTSSRAQRIRTARLLAAAGTGRPVALLTCSSREVRTQTGAPGGPEPAALRLLAGEDRGRPGGRLRDGHDVVVEPPFTPRAVTRGVWRALQADPVGPEGAGGRVR